MDQEGFKAKKRKAKKGKKRAKPTAKQVKSAQVAQVAKVAQMAQVQQTAATPQTSQIANKEFNKIPGNKKASSLIFLVFVAAMIALVFGLFSFKYRESYIHTLISEDKTSSSMLMSIAFIAIICAGIIICSIIFKSIVLKTDMTKKHTLSIMTSVLTVGVPIIGLTMLTIGNLPLMMRSFENTFGFAWIDGEPLKKLTQDIFGSENNYNDYSVITTQLFEENFKYYLTCMKKGNTIDSDVNLNRFKNVFVGNSYFDESGKIKIKVPDKNKPDDNVKNLYDLLTMVVRKRHVSEATWISLATVVTMYASYLFM
jgi:hypothetical protein